MLKSGLLMINQIEDFQYSYDYYRSYSCPRRGGIRELKQTRRRRKRERHLKM